MIVHISHIFPLFGSTEATNLICLASSGIRASLSLGVPSSQFTTTTMVNNRRGRGGFHMEGCRFDDQANNMEDLRRQVQQLSERLARYKTQNRDDENLDF